MTVREADITRPVARAGGTAKEEMGDSIGARCVVALPTGDSLAGTNNSRGVHSSKEASYM